MKAGIISLEQTVKQTLLKVVRRKILAHHKSQHVSPNRARQVSLHHPVAGGVRSILGSQRQIKAGQDDMRRMTVLVLEAPPTTDQRDRHGLHGLLEVVQVPRCFPRHLSRAGLLLSVRIAARPGAAGRGLGIFQPIAADQETGRSPVRSPCESIWAYQQRSPFSQTILTSRFK